MDFFSCTGDTAAVRTDDRLSSPDHHQGQPSAAIRPTPVTEEPVDAFAEAINQRFSRTGTLLIPLSPNQGPATQVKDGISNMLSLPGSKLRPSATPAPQSFTLTMPPGMSKSNTSSPSPVPPRPPETNTKPSSTTSSNAPIPPSSFTALLPDALSSILSDSQTLILDIRPHNSYALARLPNAVSLSVPSTLLKRPMFPLSRLTEMLSSATSRARFARWQSASQIVVYDTDSSSLNEGGNLLGLMRKFRKEGYSKNISWVKGGFHAVWRERGDLVDREPPVEEEEDGPTSESIEMTRTTSAPASVSAFTTLAPSNILRTKHLPMSAFTSSSTTSHNSSLRGQNNLVPATPMGPRANPFASLPVASMSTSLPGTATGGSFTLRPPLGRSSLANPAIPEDAAMHVFPQTDTSSLPTPGPGSITNMYGGHTRPHYNSLPVAPPQRTVAFNPFFDNIRQNIELSGGRGSGEGILLKLPRRIRRHVGDLPFDWLREIAQRSGKFSDSSTDESSDSTDEASESENQSLNQALSSTRAGSSSPEQLEGSDNRTEEEKRAGEELSKVLAMQFYKIELGEQRRLMGVMEHHSNESGAITNNTSATMVPKRSGATVAPLVRGSATFAGTPGSGLEQGVAMVGSKSESGMYIESNFPYSITAGVEKGTKNRYRNIWPFEHARVRLRKVKPEDDDYMNASYVQPLGTKKRYIATQGPLPATYTDFWTLCWEQNVHVIVMLTREVESGLVKCGRYWEEGNYGPLRLKLISTTDTPEDEKRRKDQEMSSGFFNIPVPMPKPLASKDDSEKPADTIRRVFELTHTRYPHAPPRTIIQLQYVDWPDLDVPKDPKGVLALMQKVDEAVDKSRDEKTHIWGEGPLRGSRCLSTSTPLTAPKKQGQTTLEGLEGDVLDQVDAETGVAMHALQDAPVLLHCSAGVGRTGGFIAVDAVLDGIRREMRKRKEKQVDASDPSEEGGNRNSRKRLVGISKTDGQQEAMEVDPPPQNPLEKFGGAGKLTLPVSVGKQQVHIPVVGSHHKAHMLMEVESEPRLASKRVGSIGASQDLVNEVRRAAFTQKASGRNTINSSSSSGQGSIDASSVSEIYTPTPHAPFNLSESSSGTLTTSHDSSLSGSRAGSSPVSSNVESTTSLVRAVQAADLSLNLSGDHADAKKISSVSTTSDKSKATALPPSKMRERVHRPSDQPTRLDSWRSEVRDSQQSTTKENSQSPDDSQSHKYSSEQPEDGSGDSSFDYTKPRRLHDNSSPSLLSSYNEPIRRVIEDMREQRMSLCQSLRQYVFVHRAIIEGALMIVEEEKARAKSEESEAERAMEDVQYEVQPTRSTVPPQEGITGTFRGSSRKDSLSSSSFDGAGIARVPLTNGLDVPFVLGSKSRLRTRAPTVTSSDVEMDSDEYTVPSPFTSPTRAKRQASPTELVKEGSPGRARIRKRPSVKRKERSLGEEDGSVRLGSMMIAPPPPPGTR